MTPEVFTLAAARTKLSDKGREAARAVLVLGMRASAVAQHYGMHRQSVSRATQRIIRAARDDGICPTCGRPT